MFGLELDPTNDDVFSFFLGGRFCSFSPCIEQSQRCCEILETSGFVEIQSMEVLQTEDMVRTKQIAVMDLEFVKHKVRSCLKQTLLSKHYIKKRETSF